MAPVPQADWTIRSAPRGTGLGGGHAFTAVSGAGAVLGCARVLESDGSFHLQEVSVVPERRRTGIGTALLQAVEAAVLARGASALTVLVPASGAVDFFAHLGYQQRPRLPVALRWLAAEVADDAAGERVVMGKSVASDVVPRPAVSVLPLRDSDAGLEVFVQHRVATMDFAAGAVVFPGGRVDPVDHEGTPAVPPGHLPAWQHTALPAAPVLVAAAIREVAEECGVVLDPAALLPWDNWVTPPGGRRRFDVAFFVTAVSDADREGWANTTTEADRSAWEPVNGLLSDEAAGRVRLMPPTKALLTELAGFENCVQVLAHCPLITPVEDDEPLRPRPPGSLLPDDPVSLGAGELADLDGSALAE